MKYFELTREKETLRHNRENYEELGTYTTEELIANLYEDQIEIDNHTLKRMINNYIVEPPVAMKGRVNHYLQKTYDDIVLANLVYDYVYGYGQDSKISNKFSNMAVARKIYDNFDNVNQVLLDASDITMDKLAVFTDAIQMISVQEDSDKSNKLVKFKIEISIPRFKDVVYEIKDICALPAAASNLELLDVQRLIMAYGFFNGVLYGFKQGKVWENLAVYLNYESPHFKGVTAVEKKCFSDNDSSKIAKFEEKLKSEKATPNGSPYNWNICINTDYNEGKASIASRFYKQAIRFIAASGNILNKYELKNEDERRIAENKGSMINALITDFKLKNGDNTPTVYDRLVDVIHKNEEEWTDEDKFVVDNFLELSFIELSELTSQTENPVEFVKKISLISGIDLKTDEDIRNMYLTNRYVSKPFTKDTSIVDLLNNVAKLLNSITNFEGNHYDLSAWLYIIYTYIPVESYLETKVVEHIKEMGLDLQAEFEDMDYNSFSHILRMTIENLVTNQYLDFILNDHWIKREQDNVEH